MKIQTKIALSIALVSTWAFGACTANVDMGSNSITNVAAPVLATDAANKSYVDTAVSGLDDTNDSWTMNGANTVLDTGLVGIGNANPTSVLLTIGDNTSQAANVWFKRESTNANIDIYSNLDGDTEYAGYGVHPASQVFRIGSTLAGGWSSFNLNLNNNFLGLGTMIPSGNLHIDAENSNAFVVRNVDTDDADSDGNYYTGDTENTYVGIGTDAPQETLHIKTQTDASDAAILITNDTTGHEFNDGLYMGLTASGDSYIWNYENNNLGFATNNLVRLQLLADGTVDVKNNKITNLQDGTVSTNAVNYQQTLGRTYDYIADLDPALTNYAVGSQYRLKAVSVGSMVCLSGWLKNNTGAEIPQGLKLLGTLDANTAKPWMDWTPINTESFETMERYAFLRVNSSGALHMYLKSTWPVSAQIVVQGCYAGI